MKNVLQTVAAYDPCRQAKSISCVAICSLDTKLQIFLFIDSVFKKFLDL